LDDVEEGRELAANPRAGIVLVGDGVDPQFGNKSCQLFWRARRAHMQKRLCERVGAAPERDPQRAWVDLVGCCDDGVRAGRFLVNACGGKSVGWLAGEDFRLERFSRRPVWCVQQQVRADGPISRDEGVHGLGMGRGLLPRRSAGDKRLDVDLVRVKEKPNERHLIVRLVADVGENDHALRTGQIIDMSGWDRLGGERTDERAQKKRGADMLEGHARKLTGLRSLPA
jgi:hypothetical protein